jgi:hypothetical protein
LGPMIHDGGISEHRRRAKAVQRRFQDVARAAPAIAASRRHAH